MSGSLVSFVSSIIGRNIDSTNILNTVDIDQTIKNNMLPVDGQQRHRFRCAECKAILIDINENLKDCPVCYTQNSVVVLPEKFSSERKDIKKEIIALFEDNPEKVFKIKEISNSIDVSMPTILKYLNMLQDRFRSHYIIKKHNGVDERREKVADLFNKQIKAKEIASMLDVKYQVIINDIKVLRTEGKIRKRVKFSGWDDFQDRLLSGAVKFLSNLYTNYEISGILKISLFDVEKYLLAKNSINLSKEQIQLIIK